VALFKGDFVTFYFTLNSYYTVVLISP